MAKHSRIDERSFAAFDGLTPTEIVHYWWLVVRRSGFVRSLFRSLTLIARNVRRKVACIISRAAMMWIFWRSKHLSQAETDLEKGSSTATQAPPSKPKPVVYKTASGSTVIEKRRMILHEATGDADLTSSDTSSAKPDSNRYAKISSRWRRLVGATIKWSGSRWIPRMGSRELTDELLTRPAVRAVVANAADSTVDLNLVIDLASDSSHGDWRVAAYQWLRQHADVVALEGIVSAELPHAPNRGRRAALLRIVPHLAGVFSDANAREILRHLLAAVEEPVNPYEPSGHILLARTAVVALLRQRPELDDILLEALAAGNARSDSDALPNAVQLLAVALRSRGLTASTVLADAAAQAHLTEGEIESLARLADSPLRPISTIADVSGNTLPPSPGTLFRRLICWTLVTSIFVLAALVLRSHLPSVQPPEIPIAAAIATLALLATVQVFAANLSGSRLPGAIARYTSQSWQLDVAYIASVAMVGLAVWQPSQPVHGPWTLTRNWLSTFALILWTCSLLVALLAVFRRVDSSRAAAGFVSAQKRRARLAGQRFGRYQALAIEINSCVESSMAIEIQSDAIADVWDRPILASKRGIFLPDRRGLRRIITSTPVREGLRVRLTTALASIVNRYDTVAHAVPLSDQSVDHRWLRKARRSIHVRSVRLVDDVSSGAIALSKLSADLVTAGDLGTAHQVAQTLTAFVNYHMSFTRRARQAALRRWKLREELKDQSGNTAGIRESGLVSEAAEALEDNKPAFVNPLFRDVLQIATRTAVLSSSSAANVPEYIVRSLLKSSTYAELGVSIVSFTVPVDEIDSLTKVKGASRMLRVAGLRALEQRQLNSFKVVLDRIVELGEKEEFRPQLRGLICDLSAYACRYGSQLARAGCISLEALISYPAHAGQGDMNTRGAVEFWLVGAAALAVGALSTAVYTASVAERRGWTPAIVTASSRPESVDEQAFRAQLFGNYLGDMPRDALVIYGRFLDKYSGVLRTS